MASIARTILAGLAAALIATSPALAGGTEPEKNQNSILSPAAMSKASEYVDKYADAAMEQMRKYGIPASVTLAQGILESGSGQSSLCRRGNNHFGVKASKSWLDGGGRYLIYTDDKPNEKFCHYASVADSFEHHSLILKGAKRYSDLFELAPDDYVGWTNGLQADGYATSKTYAVNLQSIIRTHGLDRYDQLVMQEEGWQGSVRRGSSTSQLAARSNAMGGDNPSVERTPDEKAIAEETSRNEPETIPKKQDKDYFNTILTGAKDGSDPWKSFFGFLGAGGAYPGADPILEMASALFAGLMAVAIQIDNQGESQAMQQDTAVQANALASRNFENAMDSMKNNTIKRTRS